MSGNEARSAECPEFASIVIELVIGNYYPLQTITCLWFQNYSSCCEVKLQLLFTVFDYYVVITFGLSIATILLNSGSLKLDRFK